MEVSGLQNVSEKDLVKWLFFFFKKTQKTYMILLYIYKHYHMHLFIINTRLTCVIQEDVCEIIEKKHAYRSSSCIEKEIEESEEGEFQEKYAHMPNVGTRVQRGPDWRWKNQDGLGAGTVIGHSEKCKS